MVRRLLSILIVAVMIGIPCMSGAEDIYDQMKQLNESLETMTGGMVDAMLMLIDQGDESIETMEMLYYYYMAYSMLHEAGTVVKGFKVRGMESNRETQIYMAQSSVMLNGMMTDLWSSYLEGNKTAKEFADFLKGLYEIKAK